MKTKPDSIVENLKSFIRQPYAWPGGYPLYAITSDGAAICKHCAKTEYRQLLTSTATKARDGWTIVAVDVNWEDAYLTCDRCSQPIESAYGGVDE